MGDDLGGLNPTFNRGEIVEEKVIRSRIPRIFRMCGGVSTGGARTRMGKRGKRGCVSGEFRFSMCCVWD